MNLERRVCELASRVSKKAVMPCDALKNYALTEEELVQLADVIEQEFDCWIAPEQMTSVRRVVMLLQNEVN